MRPIFLSLFVTLTLHTVAEETFVKIQDKITLPLLNPSLAERKTAKLRLGNGLEIYLISDPGMEQSAAALSVEAGSWQDPKEYPGMAHFLEHMLFMGTAAYPKEFEYMQYIADNGGSVNAATYPDHTVYMFSINNEAFGNALDRFSHFFIDPLLSRSCIDRELHAVDQEHSKNIENDAWRAYMICKETGNPKHPNASFSTGNASTLSGIPEQALRTWYEEHYSADQMHLTLISPLPLEDLISLASQDFARIPDREKKQEPILESMSSSKQLGHIIYIKPVKDLRQLSLVWEIPRAFVEDNDRKGLELLAYVLEAEGDNSLTQELKKEKIAERVSASVDRFSKSQAFFQIDISLTPQGLNQIDTAILRCFQALANLKQTGIPPYLFQEFQTLAMVNYQYQSREDAFSFVMRTANEMLYEELETYPQKTLTPTVYDPAYLSALVQIFTPQTCLFCVVADPKFTHVAPTYCEKWMSAEYAIKEIPQNKLLTWSQATPTPSLSLPSANPFTPVRLTLAPLPEEERPPCLIADEEMAKVYFSQDTDYLVPEISAIFGIKTPSIDGSSKKKVLTDLYLKALTERLSSTLFFADTAGLHSSFAAKDLTLLVAVQGYSEKAPLLIKEIFRNMKDLQPTAEQFELYKHSLASLYDNANKELPVIQAKELLSSILFNDAPTNHEKSKILKTLSYDEFVQFSDQLLKKVYLEGFLYGNLKQEEATALVSDIKSTLAASAYPRSEQTKREILSLPEKNGPYFIVQHTERQGNGVILLLQEGAFTLEKRAAQQVLSKALKEAFFDTLRTKQQTAYFVRAWESEEEKQLLQYFAVQSNSHHPRDLIARFELFLEDFLKNFETQIPLDRFENLKKMLVVSLQMPPENLQKMGERLYTLAFDYEGDFDWYPKRIASVSALTYQQLRTAATQFLSRENNKRLAILFEGVLNTEKGFTYEQVTQEDIRSISTYIHAR